MSQFPSAPPTGAYVPPNHNSTPTQGFNTQPQPQYGYQQPQATSPYGSAPPNDTPPSSTHKPANAFGQVGQAFDQAVIKGKPMFNKLGKTISSKLGNKPMTTPQHLQSYNSYQQHQQQSHQPTYQAQNQQLSSQPHQQYPYHSPPPQQQSPFPPSNYASPASGHPGLNNYFSTQPPPSLNNTQLSQSQANSGYNPNVLGQDGNAGGQPPLGQYNHAHSQSPFHSTQEGLNSGQQTGVIGGSQVPSHLDNPPSPQSHNASTGQFAQQSTNPQQQWSPQSQPQFLGQIPSPSPQQQTFNPTPPPLNQQWSPHHQHQTSGPTQQQAFNPTPPPQQHNTPPPPPVPVHPNQQQQPQQQWNPTSPVSPHVQMLKSILPSISPGLPQPSNVLQELPIAAPIEPQEQEQRPTPAPQRVRPEAALTEFIAELPAELGTLSLMEGSKPQSPSDASADSSYQAYRPSGTKSQSPGPGFSVPRRAVSMSSLPLADPWRFADAVTELPTREFYLIADVLYDSIDRKFAPSNTGLLEASKMLASWKAVGFAEEAAQLFAYENYSAFARLWTLEEIPHLMVPCQTALKPMWNFQPQSHSEAMRIPMGSVLSNPISASYQPALNRAGYYKYFFLEMMHEPEGLERMLTALCADTYRPGILNQPDVQKRDRTELQGLAAQAATIRSSCVSLVSQETAALMQKAPGTTAH